MRLLLFPPAFTFFHLCNLLYKYISPSGIIYNISAFFQTSFCFVLFCACVDGQTSQLPQLSQFPNYLTAKQVDILTKYYRDAMSLPPSRHTGTVLFYFQVLDFNRIVSFFVLFILYEIVFWGFCASLLLSSSFPLSSSSFFFFSPVQCLPKIYGNFCAWLICFLTWRGSYRTRRFQ